MLDQECYCPAVGDSCEKRKYYISMNKLIQENKEKGDHNRNYFITIKVTNQAGLFNIEHMDILVDDSPPERGVVSEGKYLRQQFPCSSSAANFD